MRPCLHMVLAAFALTAFYGCSSSDATPAPNSAVDGGPGTGNEDPDGGTSSGSPDGAPVVPGSTASKVKTTTESIDVDGVARSYVLAVPKTYDATRSYPLVVALHGDGQDAAGFVAFSKLDTFTGDDAILAFPDRSEDLFTPYDQNRDQKLLEAIIVAAKGKLKIDATKIWGFGYSKGAYQLNEIACKKPGLFTAMAIHAGGAPQTRFDNGGVDCPNAAALPMFVTHGANDDPGGGEFGAAYWAGLAGCDGSRAASTPAICEAYNGCNAATPVVFCVVPNQPHFPMYADAATHSWDWFKKL